MTVFTKTIEDAKEVPKVVVSSPTTTPTAPPTKERDISNSGWIPMEGGNFDRPKKERSSSFGPLSIIRLSPSPLARTPTPTLPDNGNSEKKTRRRLCMMLFVLLAIGFGLYLGAVFFHYHAKLVRFAYNEGLDHGKIAAKYQSLNLQRPAASQEMKSEKNLTAILDAVCKRCFSKPLDKKLASLPINFLHILTGSSSSGITQQRSVRGKMRICGPLRREEIEALGSIMITDTNCSARN